MGKMPSGARPANRKDTPIVTTSTEPQAGQAAANGQATAPAEAPCEDCAASPAERIMGVFALLFAAGLMAIAIDMISGQALSRLAAGLFAGEGDGQPGR
jgi:hypothetical protein